MKWTLEQAQRLMDSTDERLRDEAVAVLTGYQHQFAELLEKLKIQRDNK